MASLSVSPALFEIFVSSSVISLNDTGLSFILEILSLTLFTVSEALSPLLSSSSLSSNSVYDLRNVEGLRISDAFPCLDSPLFKLIVLFSLFSYDCDSLSSPLSSISLFSLLFPSLSSPLSLSCIFCKVSCTSSRKLSGLTLGC